MARPTLIRLSAITPKPTLHPIITSVAATVETVAALADADAAFAPSAPSLAVAEPSLLLLALASGGLGKAIGNADPFHTLGFRCGFVRGGEEAGIGSD
jgi:hypothetical protein